MRTRNGRRKVPFGTNYPMIFHDPALADLDALAFADEARELYLSANAQRLFEGGPRRLLCLGERERAGRRVWCPQRTSWRSAGRRVRLFRSASASGDGCDTCLVLADPAQDVRQRALPCARIRPNSAVRLRRTAPAARRSHSW